MNKVRYGHMVHERALAKTRAILERRRRVLDGLKTKADAERHVESVRKKIRRCFAPFPAKTALKPQVTGILEAEAFKIEKVIFQSRPGLFVTGNLYLPKKSSGKNPAVLGLCGHSLLGKADPAYQSFSQA